MRLALVGARRRRRAAIWIGRRWDALADDLAPRAQGRVTFIDAAGTVVGDSEVALGDLERVENHRDRPEVAAALAGRRAVVDAVQRDGPRSA